MRPFRFLAEPGDVADGKALVEAARRAESIGYDVMVYPDHVVLPFGLVPLLTTVAAATERLRVAAFVINNDMRHPALVAQDMASLDVLSGGRVEVAIGAGWNRPEYEALGIPFDPTGHAGRPADRGRRGHQGLLRRRPVQLRGRALHDHRPRRAAEAGPAPASAAVHRRWRPAGADAGRTRGRHRGARPADRCRRRAARASPVDLRSMTVAATMRSWAGSARPPATGSTTSSSTSTRRASRRSSPTTPARWRRTCSTSSGRTGRPVTVDEFLESPHVFIGSVNGLVAKLQEQRERLGISSIMVGDLDTLAPVVERLAGT